MCAFRLELCCGSEFFFSRCFSLFPSEKQGRGHSPAVERSLLLKTFNEQYACSQQLPDWVDEVSRPKLTVDLYLRNACLHETLAMYRTAIHLTQAGGASARRRTSVERGAGEVADDSSGAEAKAVRPF